MSSGGPGSVRPTQPADATVERRLLGNTTLAITRIGLGAWAIGGGDWCLGWGPQSDEHSVATIRRAIDLGINWIDTAGVYGLGRSETVIGRALRGLRGRERPYIFTTGGFAWDELGNVARNLTSHSIRREAETSLRRLAVDAIDLYQLDPASGEGCLPSHGGSLEEAWATLAALQREGKVRFSGVSRCQPRQLAALERIAPIASLQTPYSLLRREIEEELLPYCTEHGIGVLASSPMESGLLTGAMTAARLRTLPHNDWRRCSPSFHPREVTRAMRLVDRLREVGARHGAAPGAVAVAWTLRQPAIAGAVAGARRPEQVDELIPAGSLRLGAEDIVALDRDMSNVESAVP